MPRIERREAGFRRFAAVLASVLWALVISGARADTLDRDAALRRSLAAEGTVPGEHRFTAADGRTVMLSSFRGRPLVVNFVYTGCFQVCPTGSRFLALAVDAGAGVVGADRFAVATIGFNLPFDSPEAMRDFARRQGLERPNWRFLSPAARDLEALLSDFGFSRVATPAGFDHVLQATLLDADGRIVKQVHGESFALDALVEPLKALVAGSPVLPSDPSASLLERVRLLCTVYDPVSGVYRLDYALIAEMLAGLVVLGATVVFMARDRKRARERN